MVNTVTTLAVIMDAQAVTHVAVASPNDTQITPATSLTDSINLLQKWAAMTGTHAQLTAERHLWTYCTGYAGVRWKGRADRL